MVIVVGSGAGGATVAKELTAKDATVTLIEKGLVIEEKDASKHYSNVDSEVKVMRTNSIGGTTTVSAGNGVRCLDEELKLVGIDLRVEFEETEKELGVGVLPDSLFGEGTQRIMKAAEVVVKSGEVKGVRSGDRMFSDDTVVLSAGAGPAGLTAAYYLAKKGVKTAIFERKLSVGSDKEILKGVNLEIGDKETHVLLGPNGAGKSSLIMTIMGIPTEIRGVKLGDLIRLCGGSSMPEFMDKEFEIRDVNIGFLGGERKKSELAQLFAIKPGLMLLDEIDSGVDIESLELLGKELNSFISDCSCLIITHQGYILRYIDADMAHVLLDGKIVRSGNPDEILRHIRAVGFGGAKNE